MTSFKKLLCWIGFDIVVHIEPHFENQRVIQRGKKQILQKFVEGNYALDDYWEDIKQINI